MAWWKDRYKYCLIYAIHDSIDVMVLRPQLARRQKSIDWYHQTRVPSSRERALTHSVHSFLDHVRGANLTCSLLVVFLELWNSMRIIVLASDVGWAMKPRGNTEHIGTSVYIYEYNYIYIYIGKGRDPLVSEVRPHPALCPAHVTGVRVVIHVTIFIPFLHTPLPPTPIPYFQ